MTTARDDIGLSERLRNLPSERDDVCGVMLEAAAQLDALQARVIELEAQNERLLKYMVPISKDGNHVFIDGTGDVEIDHEGALRSRTTRAEQERDARRGLRQRCSPYMACHALRSI